MKKQQKRVSLSLISSPSLLSLFSLFATLPLAALLAGCPSNSSFAKVNGQSITREEYIKTLERQTVSAGQGQNIPAERFVIRRRCRHSAGKA